MSKPKFHLETSAGALLKALRAIGGVVERRCTIPVLGMVCFADNRVAASNLDIEISTVFAVTRFEGSLCVDYGRLLGLLVTLDADAPVLLAETESGACDVLFGQAEYTLPALPISEWSSIVQHEMPEVWKCDNAQIGDVFAKVLPAASTEETRYYLNGICLTQWSDPFAVSEDRDVTKDMPVAVATDGHRLMAVNVPSGLGFDGAIVPRKACEIVAEIGNPTEVHTYPSRTHMAFSWPGLTVTTKLIDGNFPDFQRVVPTQNGTELNLPRGATLSAIARVLAINTDRTRGLKITLGGSGPETGSVAVSTKCEGASGYEVIEQATYSLGDGFSEGGSLGISAKYLRTHYGLIGDGVPLWLADAASPMVSHHAGAVSVLMPLRA